MKANILLALVIILLSVAIFRTTDSGLKRGPTSAEKPEKPAAVIEAELRQEQHMATLHFCVADYHRESCLHYLAQCGEPCRNLIPARQLARVRADADDLARERGL
jgi:hypothetical protein